MPVTFRVEVNIPTPASREARRLFPLLSSGIHTISSRRRFCHATIHVLREPMVNFAGGAQQAHIFPDKASAALKLSVKRLLAAEKRCLVGLMHYKEPKPGLPSSEVVSRSRTRHLVVALFKYWLLWFANILFPQQR